MLQIYKNILNSYTTFFYLIPTFFFCHSERSEGIYFNLKITGNLYLTFAGFP